MVNIFLLGEDSTGMGLKICKALSHYGSVIHATEKTFTFHSTGDEVFTVSHWKNLPEIFASDCIVFLKNQEEAKNIGEIKKRNFTVIAPDFSIGSRCITYGFSSGCNISFSSTESSAPCLSVQHPFICVDGTTAQPCEITVETSLNMSGVPYELLGVCAVASACNLCKGGSLYI